MARCPRPRRLRRRGLKLCAPPAAKLGHGNNGSHATAAADPRPTALTDGGTAARQSSKRRPLRSSPRQGCILLQPTRPPTSQPASPRRAVVRDGLSQTSPVHVCHCASARVQTLRASRFQYRARKLVSRMDEPSGQQLARINNQPSSWQCVVAAERQRGMWTIGELDKYRRA